MPVSREYHIQKIFLYNENNNVCLIFEYVSQLNDTTKYREMSKVKCALIGSSMKVKYPWYNILYTITH